MRLKLGVSEEITRAVRAFHKYAAEHRGRDGCVLRQFCKEQPGDAQVLVRSFDAARPGLNCLPARYLTRNSTKVRVMLEDAQGSQSTWRECARWMSRHRLVLMVLSPVLILPMLLSPTHPIAVYPYLIHSYEPFLLPEALASTGADLPSFLTSPAQVQRYKSDLLEDMLDTSSGRLFAIVRCPDGTLKQESIRTWNKSLPRALSASFGKWVDRKELPYLGDKVDIWLRGNEVVAMGHYHAFGGAPSPGDEITQRFSDLPEIVVVNGVVPMVYLDSDIISYGDKVVVSAEVFRFLRPLEQSLTMDVTRSFSWPEEPSPALKSFLGFLRDHRNVDISGRDSVTKAILRLCQELRDQYAPAFPEGYRTYEYENDMDKSNFVRHVAILSNCSDFYVTILPKLRSRAETTETNG